MGGITMGMYYDCEAVAVGFEYEIVNMLRAMIKNYEAAINLKISTDLDAIEDVDALHGILLKLTAKENRELEFLPVMINPDARWGCNVNSLSVSKFGDELIVCKFGIISTKYPWCGTFKALHDQCDGLYFFGSSLYEDPTNGIEYDELSKVSIHEGEVGEEVHQRICERMGVDPDFYGEELEDDEWEEFYQEYEDNRFVVFNELFKTVLSPKMELAKLSAKEIGKLKYYVANAVLYNIGFDFLSMDPNSTVDLNKKKFHITNAAQLSPHSNDKMDTSGRNDNNEKKSENLVASNSFEKTLLSKVESQEHDIDNIVWSRVDIDDCEIDEEGALVDCYTGKEKNIILPDGISAIDDFALSMNDNITSVVIPEGVETIRGNAFYKCSNLESVELPSTIRKIGDSAFSETALKKIVIPDGCEELGTECFYSCSNLESVKLPSTIHRIGYGAFSETGLKKIVIPDGCEEIEEGCFADSSNLESVELPSTTRKIGNEAFSSTGLKKIVIPDGCEEIGANCFRFCKHLIDIYIPRSVNNIGDGAFPKYNDSLTIHTEKGSVAEEHAKENNIRVDYNNFNNEEQALNLQPDVQKVSEKIEPCVDEPGNITTKAQGTQVYPNGDKYTGEWKDDMKHGHGTYTYNNGEVYVGEYKDDMKHGEGMYSWPDGNKYIGEWKDDMKHGQGTALFHSGDKYTGEWKDDMENGQGTYIYSNGDKHTGEYKNGNRDGHGTLTLHDGSKYVGEFKGDEGHGQGTYIYANGDKYTGEWKDGKKHGYGILVLHTGEKYIGEFKNDEYVEK